LREAGFEFLRHGKGSHDIWRNPRTDKSVALPAKVPSRHFANKILKEVGLDKAF
jgi:predicted RNA binding protein YcfA (HicA-like mRNA interferase family)